MRPEASSAPWRPSRNRRGTFLIETLIAASVSTAILLVAIGWIHQSFKLASTVKQKQQHHQQLMRLGDQFRLDVRQCQWVEQDSEDRWVLRDSRRGDVFYQVKDGVVFRTHRAATEEQTHRDHYPLASGSKIFWDATELPRWITLVVERSRGVVERPAELRIDRSDVLQSPPQSPQRIDLRVRAGVARWSLPSSWESTP